MQWVAHAVERVVGVALNVSFSIHNYLYLHVEDKWGETCVDGMHKLIHMLHGVWPLIRL